MCFKNPIFPSSAEENSRVEKYLAPDPVRTLSEFRSTSGIYRKLELSTHVISCTSRTYIAVKLIRTIQHTETRSAVA